MWLFLVFMNKSASAMVNARLSADGTDKEHSRWTSGKKRCFTTYSEVVNFLLMKYAADEVIAETEFNITRFVQSSNMTPSQYAEKPMT